MIKYDKIAFLQILTVFGTSQKCMNCTLLDGAIKQKASGIKTRYT